MTLKDTLLQMTLWYRIKRAIIVQLSKKLPQAPGALGRDACSRGRLSLFLEKCRVSGSRKGAVCSDFRETDRDGDQRTSAEE